MATALKWYTNKLGTKCCIKWRGIWKKGGRKHLCVSTKIEVAQARRSLTRAGAPSGKVHAVDTNYACKPLTLGQAAMMVVRGW
eukprot:300706-Amphidinium_carterae.2